MNWTGGRLQRSRTANKGVIQRQKAHFARVKAQLQDSATTDSSPHRPSFFHNERVSQPRQLPTISPPHNARHEGQIATWQGPGRTASWPAHRTVAERSLLHGSEQHATMAPRHTRGRHSQRQTPSEFDPDERLLETRRNRLLQQSNWAGLAQFKSHVLGEDTRRDRVQIGKRRKIRHDHALTRLVPHPLRATASNLLNAHGEEDIRIRVGSDALSNTAPTLNSPPPSRQNLTSYGASSDSLPMIDDDLHLLTPKPGPQGLDPLCKVVGAPQYGFHEQMRGESLRSHQPYYKGNSMEEERPHEEDELNTLWSGRSRTASVNPGSLRRAYREVKDEMPACYTAHHIVRPSRLTFEKASEFPEIALMNNKASPDDAIGEPNHEHDTTNAAARETGNAVESAAGRAEARSAASTEDGPWRAFLPGLADSLSPSMRAYSSPFDRTHDGTRDRLSLAFPCPDMKSEPLSQQATDGVQTMAHLSSCISDSLCESELHESPHPSLSGMGVQTRCSKRPRDQEDGYWQRLVFGSHNANIRDFLLDTEVGPGANRAVTIAERNIPSSIAVSLSSTTPINPRIGPGSCVSDNAQDATSRAPLATFSGSMLATATSLTARLTRSDQGVNMNTENKNSAPLPPVGSDVGLRPVTHTSMQNNVSWSGSASSHLLFDYDAHP